MRWLFALALWVFPVACLAQAPGSGDDKDAASTDPQATSATYGDWVLICQRASADGAAPRVCEISQSIQVQGQQAPIARLAVYKPAQGEGLNLTAVLPPNVLLTALPRAAVDEKDTQALELSWMRCLPGGCFAETALKADVLKAWREQTERGRLEFKDAAGRAVVVPFSFNGFGAAHAALEKEPRPASGH